MAFEEFIGIWKVVSTDGSPRCTSAVPPCTITIEGTEENPTVCCKNSHRYPSPAYDGESDTIHGDGYRLSLEREHPDQKLRLFCDDTGRKGPGATGSWTANDDRPHEEPPLS